MLPSFSMARLRRFVPPPQLQEQPLQCDQLPQTQSTASGGATWHAFISLVAPKHPRPPPGFTSRDRVAMPKPCALEQGLHEHQAAKRPQSQRGSKASARRQSWA